MAIGVTYDEFWHGDPDIVRFAVEVSRVKQRQDAIAQDTLAWNLGRYVMLGTGVVLSQAFSKSSNATYPDEPLLGPELDERLAKQKRERELRKAHDSFIALATAMSAKRPN